jgi:hypothetical protein
LVPEYSSNIIQTTNIYSKSIQYPKSSKTTRIFKIVYPKCTCKTTRIFK